MDKNKKSGLDRIFQEMDELGIAKSRPAMRKSPEESKILEEFNEINRFIDEKGFVPGENLEKRSMNLPERRLRKRLSVYRQTAEYTSLLQSVDKYHILSLPLEKTEPQDNVKTDPVDGIASSFPIEEAMASDEARLSIPTSLDDIFKEGSPLLDISPEVAAMFNDPMPSWDNKQAVQPKRPDKVARRVTCQEFDRFKPLFDQCVQDLISGKRISMRFRDEQNIKKGDFFILKGVMVYVADYGKTIVKNGKTNARLRLIFNNGMEGENLLRSLARELYKDPNGRRISGRDSEDVFDIEPTPSNITRSTKPSDHPITSKNTSSSHSDLSQMPPKAVNAYSIQPKESIPPSYSSEMFFFDKGYLPTGPNISSQHQKTGSIYILRSLSQQPDIVSLKDNFFKIGFTTGDIKHRLQNAEEQPTYLLAKVEVVRLYQCSNLNVSRFENLLHRFFKKAQVEIEIKDRFGKICHPKEWFLLPLKVIDQAINLLMTGQITEYVYDIKNQSVIK